VAAALCLAPAAHAQQLTATELSAGAATVLARRSFIGGELGFARRPSGQSRVALTVAGGTAANRPAARVQMTWQFLVSPAARRGTGLYAGLGAAYAARRESPGAGFLTVVLGLEAAPGRARGPQNWYVELGLAGGVRVAAGWRLRWFPSWWSTR